MKITLPVIEVDAGKFLHHINMGAHAQIALFEERVQQMGKELGANWRLASLDQKNVFIEDIETHTYYQGRIENIGKGRVKITDLKTLKIVESKKENNFKKNVSDLINAIAEDKLQDADIIFNKIAKQRFRSNVIPESGIVTTRDGRIRKVAVQQEIVKEDDRNTLIKNIAEALKGGVTVTRGRIVEAVFGDQTIKIPITEMTRRKVVAGVIKETAKKAYMSEGFQNRVKHVAAMICEDKIEEAVNNFSEFFADNQEFSLLTLNEMRELAGNALATSCVFNKDLANDVGTVMYRTNCRVNKNTMLNEWRKTARMTECAPFVENVRILEESNDFEKDYNEFLAAIFTESSRDLNLEAAEHLLTLRKIRDILTVTKEHSEDLQKIDNYIRELEIKRENVDDAAIIEVRNFLAGLSEEIIDAAVALDAYSNPNIGTMTTFDEMPAASTADSKMFGATASGAPSDLGGIGEALPLQGAPGMEGEAGGTVPGMEGPGGEIEGLGGGGPEGGEGAPEEEGADLEELLAADVQRDQKPITEKFDPKNPPWKKKGGDEKKPSAKDGSSDKPADKPAETECASEGDSCTEEDVLKIRAAVSELNSKGLHAELTEWKINAGKFFKEDGLAKSTALIKAYIDQATALKENLVATEFEKILTANTPVKFDKPVVESEDAYPYQVTEDVKVSETGIPGKKPEKKIDFPVKKSDAMTDMDAKDATYITPQPESTLKKGSGDAPAKIASKNVGEVCCGECNSKFQVADCLKEDTAVCPRCGADVFDKVMASLDEGKSEHKMDSPEGKSIQKTGLGKVDVGGSGEKPTNDSPEGKGVAKGSLKKNDGTKSPSGSGSKECMDGQEGKAISGGVKGEVEEGSRRPPTSRKSVVYPFNKSAGFTTEEVDSVTARIAEAMGDEDDVPPEEGVEDIGGGDDVAPPPGGDVAPAPGADLDVDLGGESKMVPDTDIPPVSAEGPGSADIDIGGKEPPAALTPEDGPEVEQGTFEVDVPATSDTGDPVTSIKINLPGAGAEEGIETVGELTPPAGEVPDEIPPVGSEEGPSAPIPPVGDEGVEVAPEAEVGLDEEPPVEGEGEEELEEAKGTFSKTTLKSKFGKTTPPSGDQPASIKCPPDNKSTEKAARQNLPSGKPSVVKSDGASASKTAGKGKK